MAISLGDIKRKKTEQKELRELKDRYKERVLRPWENFTPQDPVFDQIGPRPRTHMAQQAVKRAREIVERNKVMVAEIKKRGYGQNSADDNENNYEHEHEHEHEQKYKGQQYFIDNEITSDSYKIKNKKGLWGLFKEMLGH